MRIVQLINDNREIQRKYRLDDPVFGPAPEALLEGFKALGSDVEVHVVSCLQQMPRRSPAKLADNVFYHPLHVPKIGWLRTGYQGCIRATRRKIRELQPDIVHGQGTERDCAVCAVFSGFPNVLTIHGNMQRVAEFLEAKPLTYYWFASKLERLSLKRTDGVVAISTYTQRNVAPYACRSWLVPNAVHPSFFDLPRRLANPPRILCAANIAAHKNQIGLLKALEPLAKENSFIAVFAGGGSEADPYFREFKKMLSTRPWCEYLGPLERKDLQSEMSRSIGSILPSFEDNCPMVVVEAAASRVFMAASAIGGNPDLVADGVRGILFDPYRPERIQSAVRTMLLNTRETGQMTDRAYRHCLSNHLPTTVAQRHLDIYSLIVPTQTQ
jgi:glycosyltransferase involved in cell wall biosynthesis